LISDEELLQRATAVVCRRALSEDTTAGQVGCALLTARGNVYVGVCIDTPCGIGFCAEHNAIGTMITEGESAIATIVAVNHHGNVIPPCGRCREFIHQVDPANVRTRVLLGGERVATIAELLPEHWAAAWLAK
jgi:cytidine deaminase